MKPLRRTFATLMFLTVAAAASLPSAATDVTPTQISNNVLPDGKPRVAGNRVVWQRTADATGEIVSWTPGTGTDDVTSNSFRDFDPELSNAFAIWKRSLDGTTCSLMTWDFASAPLQIVSSFSCIDAISVAGPHIGWIDDGVFFDDVFVSTDRDDPERLGLRRRRRGLRPRRERGGQPARGLDRRGGRRLLGRERGDGAPRGALERRCCGASFACMAARAVWVDEVGGDLEIFLSNGTSVQQLTSNGWDDETPSIHGNDVVWVGYPDGGGEGEIFHYDGTTTEPLTDDDLDDFDPHVSEGPDGPTIAWVKADGDDEIWMFDGCESTQITDNATDDTSPSLDGNRVAWVRGTGNSSEIWTALAECNLVCGDGVVSGDEECDDGNTESGDGCSRDLPGGDLREPARRRGRGVRRRGHRVGRRLRRGLPPRVRKRQPRPRRGVRRRRSRRR